MKILKRKTLAALLALSLLASILPLGAQPALAAENAPTTLYVGNYQITNTSGTTYLKASSTEGSLTEGSETDWTVKYDPSTVTLTLKNATIEGGYDDVNTSGDGIYAASSSGPVSLNIVLEGENKVSGGYGINVSSEGAASLSISGSGSLTVSATATNGIGIFVQAKSGNANLAINGANVNAVVTENNGRGVELSTGQAGNPNLTIEVQGGSLQASGQPNGIKFFTNKNNTQANANLKVSGNAMVKTSGITTKADGSGSQGAVLTTEAGSGETGGIVWNGSEGTVYGDVTLQENLTINQGESLTIGQDASLNTDSHEVIVNGGTITGQVNGQQSPQITASSQSQTVTEGESATFTIEASGSESLSYQWQKSTNGSDWTNIGGATSATYAITNTTKDMSGTQYRCVVTGSGVSVISSVATLMVNALTTYTINATANPAEGGTVTVNGGETSATVTEGSEATLTATVNEGWRFAGWMENGQLVSNETTYTITANGNRTLTAEFEKVYNVTVNSTAGGTATADKTTAAAGETVTLTATPNSGYHFAGWNVVSGTVTIQDKQFIMPANDVGIQAIFARNTSPTIPPTVSEKTIDAIQDAEPGETVTVDLSHGSTKLDKEVFETLAGQDITLDIDLGDGMSWTVNGSDIPENADFVDIDLGVTMNSDGIPVEVVNAITGEHGSVQMTLAYDGAFGFTMTLTAPLGAENAGYWANLYHFNEEANTMTFETAAPIGSDGSVSLALSHASQYAIVIDDHNHGVVTLPFTDVREGDWFYDPVCYVYSQGLMTGTSDTTFEPNTPLSRAMLVAVLHRLEGSPTVSGGDFTDVAANDWYATAVNWAAASGITSGTGDGNFSPNTAITREQLAAILMNYAQYKGQDVSARATLDTYNDATAISSWANDVMSWAVAEGLLTGVTNDQLQPQGNATRAQVAAILERFLAE